LAAHCRADLVTECMKRKKKTTNIITYQVTFHFHLSAKNECPFSFSFVNEISFSSAFSFKTDSEKCFSVGL